MESQKRTTKIFILGKLQNLLQSAEPLQFLNKGSFQSEKLLKVQPLYRSSTFLCFKAVGEYYQWLQGKQKMHGIYLYLLSCILVLELALIYKHKEDTLDHAFIDEYGKAILAAYALLFSVLLVKVALSDLYAKVYQYKSGVESSRKL